ncbi:MAG: malate dehydrogenase, partial [Candidatus Thermoplasmatota archaeon]|nr:malate dehydrogenase [Candidatus Thermoplasmatota archaeon]
MATSSPIKKVTVEELLEKAKAPNKHAMELHPFYHGKIEVVPKCAVRSLKDFAIWYTPGVAQPCLDINKHPEMVWEHTNKGNMVAVVSDGTRVLGLGDIGPEAAIPVMEGKALIFKYLGGVDAFPICLKTKDPEKIIETVKLLQPCFGGINLEDIEQPKCFDILDRLRADPEVQIPIWHDDQQGTAAIILAGLINAVKLTGRKISQTKVVMVGAGAANVRAAYIMIKAGFKPGNIIMCDSKGALHMGRPDAKKLEAEFKQKWDLTKITNKEGITGDIQDALKGADAFVAASRPGPGVIKPEWVKAMANDAIAFSCANPVP